MSEKTNNQNLYRIMIGVDFTPQHPLYWKASSGVLMVWLLDTSIENAQIRAAEILTQLPYEITSETSQIIIYDSFEDSLHPQNITEVLGLGVSMFLIAGELESEEVNFDKVLQKYQQK